MQRIYGVGVARDQRAFEPSRLQSKSRRNRGVTPPRRASHVALPIKGRVR